MNKTKILLFIYSFASIFLGKFLADTPSGIDYTKYIFWLIYVATNMLVLYLLAYKIDLLEKTKASSNADATDEDNLSSPTFYSE